jgi:hypothetical protein
MKRINTLPTAQQEVVVQMIEMAPALAVKQQAAQ